MASYQMNIKNMKILLMEKNNNLKSNNKKLEKMIFSLPIKSIFLFLIKIQLLCKI